MRKFIQKRAIILLVLCCLAVFFTGCIGEEIPGGNKPDVEVDNQYTITFESNGGTAVVPITQEENTVIMYPANPSKEGYSFDGWYLNEELTQKNMLSAMPKQNVKLYAKWKANEYTITFETNGGNQIDPLKVPYCEMIEKPADPVKDGFDFTGWYIDEELENIYTFDKMPAKDFKLYAGWEVKKFTITFETNGGDNMEPLRQVLDTIINVEDATRVGYDFVGWFSDTDCTIPFNFEIKYSEDVTLYAKWKIQTHTITFNTNGGNEISAITGEYDTTLEMPADPTKAGCTFVGWFIDETFTTAFTLTTMPGKDITLYAKWDASKFTITFESNGGSAVEPITDFCGENVSAPTAPTKASHDFLGWFTDIELTKPYTFDVIPAENITLYAKWQCYFRFINYKDHYAISEIYNKELTEITIPAEYNDMPVTEIWSNSVFKDCNNLTKIIVSDNLIDANISDFTICPELEFNKYGTSLYLGTESNPYFMLVGTKDKTITNCDIHADTKVICGNAFSQCKSITKLGIPDGVIAVGSWAFSECEGVKSISVPETLKFVGSQAFNVNSNDYMIANIFTKYEKGYYLGNATNPYIILALRDYNNDEVSFKIHADTIILYDFVFNGYSKLETLEIPGKVAYIAGFTPFLSCVKLKTITVDESNAYFRSEGNCLIKKSNNVVVLGCGNSVIPKSVVGIGVGAFDYCEIYSITIPGNVKYIDSFAFENSRLCKIVIEEGLEEIGSGAFCECRNLDDVVTPASLRTIKNQAFARCSGMTNITLKPGVTEIGSEAFSNSQIKEIVLPDTVTVIDDGIFTMCNYLTSVSLSHSITVLPENTFSNCENLTRVVVPRSVKRIVSNAFCDCKSLEHVYIPKEVVEIYSGSFRRCRNLIVHCEIKKAPYTWGHNWQDPYTGGDAYFDETYPGR